MFTPEAGHIADTERPENYCIECKGSGIFGGPGSYYDVPGRGKPCPVCDGTGVEPEHNDGCPTEEA